MLLTACAVMSRAYAGGRMPSGFRLSAIEPLDAVGVAVESLMPRENTGRAVRAAAVAFRDHHHRVMEFRG